MNTRRKFLKGFIVAAMALPLELVIARRLEPSEITRTIKEYGALYRYTEKTTVVLYEDMFKPIEDYKHLFAKDKPRGRIDNFRFIESPADKS